ncbi:MAG: hypothetical protein QNJ33_02045 [Crocosphaera sp.]|nr:hypothetical protein [Crocosphaera sp.]
MLENPAQLGSFPFTSAVYAPSGLNYGNNPIWNEYTLFESPTANFESRRINLLGIAETGQDENGIKYPWPFGETDIPINGIIRIPIGDGPFPLALFAHGNHGAQENSTPGYLYLCELLASYGIIAATIDVNFLNGGNRGENDGRAIVHLEHIKQFQLWNSEIGHPLNSKVDMSKIMIVGHSRGGEAVGHASYFNTLTEIQFDEDTRPFRLDGSEGLGPYNFNIEGVIAIAPTDGQYIPLSGATKVQNNYLILHGSRDADVWPFDGYKTYDRSHTVDLNNPTKIAQGFKSLLWIYKANHNFFNSIWQQESRDTLTRQEQEEIAKVYISAMAQVVLLGKTEYLGLLKNYNLAIESNWLPESIQLVSQFQSPERLFVQHFEEIGPDIVVSQPVQGNIENSNTILEKLSLDKIDEIQLNGQTTFLGQETQGLKLEWDEDNGFYAVNINPNTVDITNMSVLSFRVAQSATSKNTVNVDQDFSLSIRDRSSTISFVVSSINTIPYPDIFANVLKRTIMQTFRISLNDLQNQGLNINDIIRIELSFNRTSSGTLYLDELQFAT